MINVGSVNGIDPPLLETYAYSSSKAALHMLTKSSSFTSIAPYVASDHPSYPLGILLLAWLARK